MGDEYGDPEKAVKYSYDQVSSPCRCLCVLCPLGSVAVVPATVQIEMTALQLLCQAAFFNQGVLLQLHSYCQQQMQ
jgi:hypothetical protein